MKEYTLPLGKSVITPWTYHSHIQAVESTLGMSIVSELGVLPKEVPRVLREVNRFVRNATIVEMLKYLYQDTCQVCGVATDLGFGERMSEVHHIHPLKHNGPDVPGNMIVVCPTHHTMFDEGAITINLETKRVIHVNEQHAIHDNQLILKHAIDGMFLHYYNQSILKKVSDASDTSANDN